MKTFSNDFKRSSITVSSLATVANSPRQSKITKNVKKVAEIKDVKKVKTDFGRISNAYQRKTSRSVNSKRLDIEVPLKSHRSTVVKKRLQEKGKPPKSLKLQI